MRKIYWRLFYCIKFLLSARKTINAQTYFPEKKKKNKKRIFYEHLIHSLAYGENYRYYFVYGMDVIGHRDKDYMDYNSFMKLRDRLNLTTPYSYVCLLRDKRLFGIVASAYGLRTASNLAMIQDGKPTMPLETILDNYHHLFCKPVDSYCGIGVFEIVYKNNEYYIDSKKCTYENLLHYINGLEGDFIIQPYIEQHGEISAIYDKSINTVRIVTVNPKKSSNPEDVLIMAKLLRLGVNGMNVDNWARGGIVVGINDDGTLMKYGFYKPGHGTKTENHPDSGVVFEGRGIPMYKELVNQVKLFHSKLNGIHSIGWDVAITNEGPLFIEGNDDYELGFLQTCFGGMRNRFEKYYK